MAAAQTGHPDAEPTGRPDAAPTKEPTVNAALPVPPSEQPNAASKTSEKTGENTSSAHRQPSPLRVAPLDGAAAELEVKTERRPTAAGGGPCARLARASRELAALTCRTQYIPLYISFFTFQAGISLTLPVTGVYLEARGITPGELAIFGFVTQMACFFSRTGVALAADRTSFHRPITAGVLVLAAISFSLMLLVPQRQPAAAGFEHLNVSRPDWSSSTPIGAAQNDARAGDRSSGAQFKITLDLSFWTAFLTRAGGYLFMNPVGNLSDALAFSVIACVLGLDASASPGGRAAVKVGGDGGSDNGKHSRIELLMRAHKTTRNERKRLNDLSPMNDLDERPPRQPAHVDEAAIEAEKREDTAPPHSEKKSLEMAHVGCEEPLLDQIMHSGPCPGPCSCADVLPAFAEVEAEAIEKEKGREADDENDRRRLRVFGVVRSSGSFGFLVVSGCFALLMRAAYAGAPPTDTIAVSLIGADVVWLVSAVAFLFYRPGRIAPNQNLVESIGQFIRIPDIVFLFAFVFAQGIFFGILETYLFLYLRLMGGDTSLFYAVGFVYTLSEVVIIMNSSLIIGRIGYLGSQLLVLGAYIVRFVGYALIPGAWWNLPLDALHGVTMGLQLVSMASHIALVAPRAMQPSAQGLAAGIYFGPGIACGYLIGGGVYELFGPRVLWWTSAALAFVALGLFSGIHLLRTRRRVLVSKA